MCGSDRGAPHEVRGAVPQNDSASWLVERAGRSRTTTGCAAPRSAHARDGGGGGGGGAQARQPSPHGALSSPSVSYFLNTRSLSVPPLAGGPAGFWSWPNFRAIKAARSETFIPAAAGGAASGRGACSSVWSHSVSR